MAAKKKKEEVKTQKHRFTRKYGIWMMVIGIAMQFLNIITYGLWQIDIDILGAVLFIIGLVVTIMKWKVK